MAEATGPQLVAVAIEDEMRQAYLDYSMSVIVGRALPDVRDGLKPVHRRIRYAMFDQGMLHNKRYSKCAGTVGEVLKKYHPHGDAAVYDALVRLAQEWNLRHPLIDGQGNFGSIDGDSAAAYRYTEARLTRLAEMMLADIDKDTVDFGPNFDDSTTEPLVLPTRFPNLLVNGSAGIAVGMATNVPPHNLGEVIESTIQLIDHPEAPLGQLLDPKLGATMLSIDRGQPRTFGLKAILERFIAHRRDVVTRRTRYELRKAKEREHILLGYKIALDHIDEIIALIKASASRDEASQKLQK